MVLEFYSFMSWIMSLERIYGVQSVDIGQHCRPAPIMHNAIDSSGQKRERERT